MDGEPEALSDTATNCNLASASETLSDNNNYQAKLDSLEKKAVHLRLTLEKDFKAADLKWSLFVAAAFSFRYESCLRPFPPVFMKNGIKDMDELLSLITDVPALDLVLQQLDNLENLTHITDILDLLFYVLVRLKEPSLKTMPQEAHEAILTSAQSLLAVSKPQYIFQVVSSCKSNAELKWKELSKNRKVFYAYHGNRLENFYSILNFGLQHHLHKTNLTGNGVNLSSELSLSLPYSHGGFGWGASCIGGHLSCIAMCEVIDAPEGINYQEQSVTNEGDGVYEKDKTLSAGTEARIPSFVVTNCDLIRVRYLLVYAKQPTSMRFPTTSSNREGATHGAEIIALLGNALMLQVARRPASQNEKQLSIQFRKYITNFVKFGSPDNLNEWPRYMVGDSYIHEICKKEDSNNCNKYKSSKEIAFWLQYLPRLFSTLTSNEQAEKVITAKDEKRQHGGVLALCGVSIILLLLLCVCVIILNIWRSRRPVDIGKYEAN